MKGLLQKKSPHIRCRLKARNFFYRSFSSLASEHVSARFAVIKVLLSASPGFANAFEKYIDARLSVAPLGD
jgi:hypothetical protein